MLGQTSAAKGFSGAGGRLARAALGTLVLVLLLAGPASAGVGDYKCTDAGRVYHGNARLIRNPAVVSADRVYGNIAEYQQIVRENLTEADVRYHFLMKQASGKFTKAVREMARAFGHDFVAETGSVVVVKDGAPEPPDRTDDVISHLT